MARRTPSPRLQRRAPRSLEWKRTLPAAPRQAGRALEDLLRALREARSPCGDLDEIRTALREALNNALRHGSRLNPRRRIRLRCGWDSTTGLEISVRDEGGGFDPRQVPDPTAPENLERFSGRGIYLIRRLMDEVEFRDAGREIRMRRRPRP